MEEYKSKIEADDLQFHRITNADLVCRDCKFRFDDSVIFGNTSRCLVYTPQKPGSVLVGKSCPYYRNK